MYKNWFVYIGSHKRNPTSFGLEGTNGLSKSGWDKNRILMKCPLFHLVYSIYWKPHVTVTSVVLMAAIFGLQWRSALICFKWITVGNSLYRLSTSFLAWITVHFDTGPTFLCPSLRDANNWTGSCGAPHLQICTAAKHPEEIIKAIFRSGCIWEHWRRNKNLSKWDHFFP